MGKRELRLCFEAPGQIVRPDRLDVRPWLEVLLRLVQLVEKVGAHEALDAEPPFAVVMKALRSDALETTLDFVPRYAAVAKGRAAAARRAGVKAVRLATAHLAQRSVGPTGVRHAARRLADALGRLPSGVLAHLHGRVEASLSELAIQELPESVIATECFRAAIVRAGGTSPRVQLKVFGQTRPLTIEAPEHLAKIAGHTLYAETDVTARLERAEDGALLAGELVELRILDSGDPVAALDRWYERAGRPWAKVKNIERGLGRGHQGD